MTLRQLFRRRPHPRPDDEPTVICLDPAIFNGATSVALRGFPGRAGKVKRLTNDIPIPTPVRAKFVAWLLNRELTSATVPVIVIGWSDGARIIALWQRKYGPTSTVDPSRVTFIQIGNPERKYGGACVVPSPPRKLFGTISPKADYGGPGLPENTPWTTIDYARQYDGWADLPRVESPCAAALSVCDDGIHCNYFTVGLDDDDVLTYTEGNVTYALKPARCVDSSIEADFERPPYQPGGLTL